MSSASKLLAMGAIKITHIAYGTPAKERAMSDLSDSLMWFGTNAALLGIMWALNRIACAIERRQP